MSIDKSLKKHGTLLRSRNVLKRDERIARLLDQDRWQAGTSPFGLPKVRVFRVTARKAKKKAQAEPGAEEAKAS
jgi:small basic protein (TIGR04137 family)